MLDAWAAVPVIGMLVVVTVAVIAGIALEAGDREGVMLPIAAAAGLGLAMLAFTRFELFLPLMLVMRASMDAAKVGASSVDATGALSVVFIGATMVWLHRQREGLRDPSPADGLLLPFTAFFASAILSIAFSSHPLDSAVEAVRIGTVVVIVIALGRFVTDRARLRSVLIAVLASSLVPLGVAALQLRGGRGLITFEGFSRISGTFTHPNPFATYLSLILVLCVALFPHVKSAWRWGLAALTVACGGVLIATYARGAWLATLVALTLIAILQSRRLLWVLAAAVVVVGIAVPSVAVRLSDLSESRAESGAAGNSLAWRLQYWEQVLSLQEDPLFGIGLREVEQLEEAEKAPHNDFIRVYVETGIVGLLAYLWLLVTLFREAVRAYRRSPPGLPRGLAVAFLATFSGLVVMSIAANVISQLVILWYFAAIVVLALAASRSPSQAEPTPA